MNGGTDRDRGLDRHDVISIIAMLGLILLSVLWPAPVLWLNELTVQAPLEIDEEAFLGREAVQWDVVFWWIAGIIFLTIGRTDTRYGGGSLETVRTALRGARAGLPRAVRRVRSRPVILYAAGSLIAVVTFIKVIDPLVTGWLMKIDQSRIEEATSLANRFGGGLAPALTIMFVGMTGLCRGRERWTRLFMAMVAASILSGVVLQVLKVLASRSRPELWYGPLDFWSGGASLPSGHTLSAFVVAGAIALTTRSHALRMAVLSVAVIVAVTRVMTFRHWPSDVVISALLGLGAVSFCLGLFTETRGHSAPGMKHRRPATRSGG